MERIGIYGGTFNPPHSGHIHAAQCAVEVLNLDQLLVIPDRIAPHKELPQDSPTPEQRFEMLNMSVDGLENIRISNLEMNREGTSYTYETVHQIRRLYPDATLYLLMGTDMFLTFDQWRNSDQILNDTILSVFYRGEKQEGQEIGRQKKFLEQAGAEVVLIENPVVNISSTDLRRMLIFRCAKPYLHPQVQDYIIEHGLYGTSRDYRGLPMEELETVVKGLMKQNRIAHVLGVRDTAAALARCWGANETDAARAGLLHDITKALGPSLQLTLCAEYGTILDDFSTRNPKTLHALTGSLVAQKIFGENAAVVSAIRHHTTGRAQMELLEKIVYVADYMEPNRTFDGVERLRELAFSDLDGALELGLSMTIELLTQQKRTVSPESKEALDWIRSIK